MILVGKKMIELIYSNLEFLNDFQKQIIIKKFGLDGNNSYTIKEIEIEFGISQKEIIQIENFTFNTLKNK